MHKNIMSSISVCIPCISKHIPLLRRCIQSIYKQIILPIEVIISVSSVDDEDDARDAIEQLIGQFRKRLNIIILCTTEQKYAGENRNIAIAASSGKIVSMIDADDVMYSNRLYVIKRIFDNDNECVGVLHHFSENESVRNEKWNFDQDYVKSYTYSQSIHFGHPSFLRSLFDKVRYSTVARMQDIKFVDYILPEHRSNLTIYEKKLSHYNSNDSTFYNK
ncbi:MAG: glycosyltransferase family A protein [Cetobacterium sp.]